LKGKTNTTNKIDNMPMLTEEKIKKPEEKLNEFVVSNLMLCFLVKFNS
jgi:hypothetical protein